MDSSTKITVLTPTYNRAYILEQLFHALQRQSYRDFEWLVIDDGSADETEALVRRMRSSEEHFPIRYYRKENGGKCSAINLGLQYASGELFLVVDSDDLLTDDALEKVALWRQSLPDGEAFCGVSGNLGLSTTETPNHLFPDEYYDGTMLDRYFLADGERAFAFFTEIHRHYLYPLFSDERFMTEAVAWNRMAADGYKMRFYNDIICVYEYRSDGLTNAGNRLFLQNPKGYALFLREKELFLNKNRKSIYRLWYSYYCEMAFCEEEYRLTKREIAEYVGAPLWAIYSAAALHRVIEDN